jgi:MFS family permease
VPARAAFLRGVQSHGVKGHWFARYGLTFLVGIVAVGSQILIPLGLDLTPPERRGNTVGVLMTGVLVGILLARTVSGFVGAQFGWRFMYAAAAVVMVLDGFVLLARLPHHPPSLKMGYGRLMHSMVDLLRNHPPLWIASIVSGLSFAGFMAFWTALSYLGRRRGVCHRCRRLEPLSVARCLRGRHRDGGHRRGGPSGRDAPFQTNEDRGQPFSSRVMGN